MNRGLIVLFSCGLLLSLTSCLTDCRRIREFSLFELLVLMFMFLPVRTQDRSIYQEQCPTPLPTPYKNLLQCITHFLILLYPIFSVSMLVVAKAVSGLRFIRHGQPSKRRCPCQPWKLRVNEIKTLGASSYTPSPQNPRNMLQKV